MTEILGSIAGEFNASSILELTAVLFAIIYLLLAVKEHNLCWPAAIISTLIFLFIFQDVNLYMESALQLYYIAMAIYGWYHWKMAGDAGPIKVSIWRWQQHAAACLFIIFSTFVSGYLLNTNTGAELPFLDSFTTWASIVTTFMVAQKILENWIYWLLIDSVSIYLYLDRELYFTALLFCIYIVIIFFGWFSWLKSYRQTLGTA